MLGFELRLTIVYANFLQQKYKKKMRIFLSPFFLCFYHKVDKDIHRLESNEVYTDDELTLLRKKRLKLKDQLFEIINH